MSLFIRHCDNWYQCIAVVRGNINPDNCGCVRTRTHGHKRRAVLLCVRASPQKTSKFVASRLLSGCVDKISDFAHTNWTSGQINDLTHLPTIAGFVDSTRLCLRIRFAHNTTTTTITT